MDRSNRDVMTGLSMPWRSSDIVRDGKGKVEPITYAREGVWFLPVMFPSDVHSELVRSEALVLIKFESVNAFR